MGDRQKWVPSEGREAKLKAEEAALFGDKIRRHKEGFWVLVPLTRGRSAR